MELSLEGQNRIYAFGKGILGRRNSLGKGLEGGKLRSWPGSKSPEMT